MRPSGTAKIEAGAATNSPPASSVDKPENDQKQDGADSRGDDRRQDTEAKMDTQSGQQPIADESADDADAKIRHKAETGASHDLTGEPTRDQSDHQNDEQTFT
jgi:hypothetical protein